MKTKPAPKMPARTLAALKASIAKWRRYALGTARSVILGQEYCPLCRLFNTDKIPRNERCFGCPVAAKTDRFFCRGTPFRSALKAHERFGPDSEKFKSAAREELEFLKSLLPFLKSLLP
jgi:hypothetical protein